MMVATSSSSSWSKILARSALLAQAKRGVSFPAAARVRFVEDAELQSPRRSIVVERLFEARSREQAEVAERLHVGLGVRADHALRFAGADLIEVDLLDADQRSEPERGPIERDPRAGPDQHPLPGDVRRVRQRKVRVE